MANCQTCIQLGAGRWRRAGGAKKKVALMGYIGYNIGVYMGIMEKKMETTILGYIEEFFRSQSFTWRLRSALDSTKVIRINTSRRE